MTPRAGHLRFFAGGLAAAALLVYHWRAVLFDGAHFFVRDLLLFAAPVKQYWAERVFNGEMPWWTPYAGGGMPYLAEPSNQGFYPLNLVLLFPWADSFARLDGFLLTHLLAAPLAMYVLCRGLQHSRGAAAFAGLTYGLCGYVLSIGDNVNYLPAVLWGPLIVAGLLPRRRGVGMWLAGACAACLILAGTPIDALCALALAALVRLGALGRRFDAGYEGVDTGTRAAQRGIGPALISAAGPVVLAGVAAVVLAAIQILPTYEMMQDSIRAGGLSLADASAWSFPAARYFELVHPYFFGSEAFGHDLAMQTLYPRHGAPWAKSVYLGGSVILLGAIAALRGPGAAAPWLIAGLVFALLAVGPATPLFELAHEIVPGFGAFRYPEKFLFWVSVVLVVLASAGLDALGRREKRRATEAARKYWLFAGVLLVLVVALTDFPTRIWLTGERLSLDSYWSARTGLDVTRLQGLALHAGVLFVLLAAAGWPKLPGGFRRFAVASIAIADLAFVHAGFPPTSLHDWALESRAGLTAISQSVSGGAEDSGSVEQVVPRAGTRLGRVYYDDQVRQDLIDRGRARDVGHGAVGERAWVRLMRTWQYRQSPFSGWSGGIRYLNSRWSPLRQRWQHEREMKALELAPAETLARASVAHVFTTVAPHSQRWDDPAFEEVSVHQSANLRVLAVRDVLPWARCVGSAQRPEAVRRPTAETIRITFPEDRPGPCRLEVAESWYPGWVASSADAPIELTAPAGGPHRYLSVLVPAEVRDVELRFVPSPHATAGLIISGCGLLGWAALVVSARRRAKIAAVACARVSELNKAPHGLRRV